MKIFKFSLKGKRKNIYLFFKYFDFFSFDKYVNNFLKEIEMH